MLIDCLNINDLILFALSDAEKQRRRDQGGKGKNIRSETRPGPCTPTTAVDCQVLKRAVSKGTQSEASILGRCLGLQAFIHIYIHIYIYVCVCVCV